MIVYLHGFRSSPQSFKAQLIGRRLHALGRASEYLCPQLPAAPAAAMQVLESLLAPCAAAKLALIGSSLGGYYATWLAERLGCRAVVLNPAVAPLPVLRAEVGSTTAWHSDQPFEFKAEYLQQLAAYAVPAITRPQRYFLIAATGDEVLDWRQMVAHYAGAQMQIVDGGDHGLSGFAAQLDEVLAFCR